MFYTDFDNSVSRGKNYTLLAMFMLICSTNRLVADGGPGTVKCKHNPHYSEKHENSILNVGDLTLTFNFGCIF